MSHDRYAMEELDRQIAALREQLAAARKAIEAADDLCARIESWPSEAFQIYVQPHMDRWRAARDASGKGGGA